jgi:ribosomal protein S18 acetylase RimI-like enzyme
MRKVEMRRATADDVDLLWTIFRASLKDYIIEARGEWNEEREESQFWRQLDLSASRIIAVDHQHIGFIVAPIRDGALWIHTICIVPEYQRKGIGTGVIRSVFAEGKEQEIPIYLGILKVNPARRLYERLGFKVIGDLPNHYKMQFQSDRIDQE